MRLVSPILAFAAALVGTVWAVATGPAWLLWLLGTLIMGSILYAVGTAEEEDDE